MKNKKFLNFEEKIIDNEKFYFIANKTKNKDCLGYISFYKTWKKWIFQPESNSFFDYCCLKEIINFMQVLKK